MKVCTECNLVKELNQFSVNKRKKFDGRQPKCKDCNRAYYLANREKIKARVNKHYHENHEAELARRAELRKRPEAKKKKSQLDKSYYLKNKDKIKEYYKEWASKNRDVLRAVASEFRHKREAWLRNNESTLTKKQIRELFSTHPFCEYCGSTEKLTLDHIIPVSRGGPNTLENVTIACKSCNSSKNNKTLEEWKQTQTKT